MAGGERFGGSGAPWRVLLLRFLPVYPAVLVFLALVNDRGNPTRLVLVGLVLVVAVVYALTRNLRGPAEFAVGAVLVAASVVATYLQWFAGAGVLLVVAHALFVAVLVFGLIAWSRLVGTTAASDRDG
ncbi:hypothetical protein [Actinokineospora terrae]|uniref:Uncharacterized protein n=1 Tax=Actinokineospora terrae TaxID=155974 RepID=A0A1H9S1F0_9PSEU|nr:hypothetical protein [Actinokineospora terrae]SER78183.1 hypothetical protein SAMN04487818_105196 [Actinokineospora terrae]